MRLHEVWQLVRDLRAQGRNRGLLNAVWYRLADQSILDSDDVAEGLEQLRSGLTRPAPTQEEEEAQGGK
ncbi:hypothetical protein ACFZB9_13845 [Kitasatospora sp. NPDC008050]|uniref:hypothetical protein n=1 Tax=Kitasatospora sp. NPDC008050 TaxID=3364021 RepID=UPI0036F0B27D